MCFTFEVSVGFFTFELFVAVAVFSVRDSWPTLLPYAWMALYFSLMEGIQVVNYLVGLDDPPWEGGCREAGIAAKLCVILGFAHVCFQPWVTHYTLWWNHVMVQGPRHDGWRYVLNMCALAGLIDLTMVLQPWLFGKQGTDVYDWDQCGGAAAEVRPGVLEHAPWGRRQHGVWYAGNDFCAFRGDTHLGWSIPFPAPTYFRQGTLHFFAFFGPYFAKGLPSYAFAGVVMMLTGPILAEWATDGARLEAAATWCFWSPVQTFFPYIIDIAIPWLLGRPFDVPYDHPDSPFRVADAAAAKKRGPSTRPDAPGGAPAATDDG